jgi:hypothetical protein
MTLLRPQRFELRDLVGRGHAEAGAAVELPPLAAIKPAPSTSYAFSPGTRNSNWSFWTAVFSMLLWKPLIEAHWPINAICPALV